MQMIWRDLIQRLIFISLTGLGVLGNIILFVRHVNTLIMSPEKKSIDVILTQNILGDVGCKTIIYLERVARGLSICTTYLLSVVQAVTISPRTTLCRKLKPQTAWQVLPFLLLFWIFNSLISSNLLHYITATRSTNRSEAGTHTEYCRMLPSSNTAKWLFLALMALRDVVFQSLMGWSSGSMALHLYKHHIRVLYLHSSRKGASVYHKSLRNEEGALNDILSRSEFWNQLRPMWSNAVCLINRASGWRRLRPKSAWHILPFFSSFWILNALIGMNLIYSITSTSLNISELNNSDNYCYFMLESQKTKWIVLPLMVLRDAVFQGTMAGASGY
ncbi:hypothetical protein U0070_027580, partial [Myodes glareolus]